MASLAPLTRGGLSARHEVPLGSVGPERALLCGNWPGATLYDLAYRDCRTDVTSQIDAVVDSLSAQGVVLPHRAAVRDYLLQHQDMIAILSPICKAAIDRFGPQTELSLDVYSDPEFDDKYLTLYVRKQSYADNILDEIESLSSAFQRDLSAKTGWLLVTTDFRPPR